MSGLALPVASGSGNLGRFAVNAAGAGLGLMVAANYVIPAMPSSLLGNWVGWFGGDDLVYGACAIVGAMLANHVYNKIAG